VKALWAKGLVRVGQTRTPPFGVYWTDTAGLHQQALFQTGYGAERFARKMRAALKGVQL
jgi:hypothetical protein